MSTAIGTRRGGFFASAPPLLLPLSLAAFAISTVGPNLWLSFLACLVLFTSGYLLWRPGEPPILLAIAVYQWLQASVAIFFSNWFGTDISEFSLWGGQTGRATSLSLLAILFLSLGMRLGAQKPLPLLGKQARTIATSRPIVVWFKFYLIAALTAFLALTIASRLPAGLSQPLLALANLKWAFFWMLAYATFAKSGQRKRYFAYAFAIEFASGFGGYFSDFKTVFIFSAIALLAVTTKLRLRTFIGMLVFGFILFGLAVVWSAVKNPYRQSLNDGGEVSQGSSLGYVQSVGLLASALPQLNKDTLLLAAGSFFHRLSYVDFFGVVLDYVPASIPYANGALWADALERPFMPRLLFPGKQIVDDTARTNYYTGNILYTGDATSISIGYVGESYIDFGGKLMMLPLFLLGLCYGWVYRWLLTDSRSRGPLGMGLACTVLFTGFSLESSITKVLGGMIVSALMAWLLIRYLAPRIRDFDRKVTLMQPASPTQ